MKINNKMFINSIVLTLYIFATEMVLRLFTESNFLDIAVLRIFLSTVIISLIISYIGRLFKDNLNKIWNIVVVLFIGIYAFIEFGLYSFIGFFMGVGNTEQGTKVLDYVKDLLNGLEIYHWTILIPMILSIIYFVFFDKKIKHKFTKVKNVSIVNKVIFEVSSFVLLLVFASLLGVTIKDERMQNELQAESNYSLWLYPENSNLAVNNYGVLMYGFCDLKSIVFNIDAEKVLELEQKPTEEKKPTVIDKNSRIIDDTAWKKLNESTTNKTYQKLNDYFMNRSITSKNEMTGIFKGKNLIIILMESVNEIPIINDDFKTLSKLYNEGISFRNNYSPRNNCATGNNEFTVLSSLYTINNTCTANTYSKNKYFEGAFNIFKNAGYKATSYHDFSELFYKRSRIHKNLGSEKFYSASALGISYNEATKAWPDDKLLFQKSQKYYMNEDKFMTYFATVSPHHSYYVSSKNGEKYKNKWMKKGYSQAASRYLSKLQVLDEALAELLKELEETKKLDDTVIALFGDHYPYGLTDSAINEYLTKNKAPYKVNRNSTSNRNVDRTPLIIYNSKTEPMKVEDYTSLIDLLPTLLNMFDMDYDPRLYLGTDIFSKDHESRVYFADGSWTDEKGYYHAPSNKMNYKKGVEKYSSQELVSINKEIKKRQSMSTLAIKNNYFNYLGNGLDEYKKDSEKESKEETKK